MTLSDIKNSKSLPCVKDPIEIGYKAFSKDYYYVLRNLSDNIESKVSLEKKPDKIICLVVIFN